MISSPEPRTHHTPAQRLVGALLLFRLRLLLLLSRMFRPGDSDGPEDPHAYVTAPKKPRLPHLSAAAVAEIPEP